MHGHPCALKSVSFRTGHWPRGPLHGVSDASARKAVGAAGHRQERRRRGSPGLEIPHSANAGETANGSASAVSN